MDQEILNRNKSVVIRYHEALNRGDISTLDQFFAPSYKRYFSPATPPLAADGQKKGLAALLASFPDIRFTFEDVVAEDDLVAIRVITRGTHKGTFQGIPPTGKPVTVSGIELFRIENGRIVEHWGTLNAIDALRQMGAVISAPK